MKSEKQGNKTEVWKQASEVFVELSDLSVDQALLRLKDIQNISPEVRNAIITLINSGSQASQYFQKNILSNFNINLQSSIKVGQILEGYELLEVLGQGGMSQVFKARRVHADSQKLVAIKIFTPKNNSPELLNLFIKEQQILAAFSHRYIIDMQHGSKTKEGVAYLVMEWIEEALPLNEFCRKHATSLKNKIQFIAHCADAMIYSHANLIIHQDIKPDNILVDKNHKLKIVDFGIAKLINENNSGDNNTLLALTPNYAAPEQVNSKVITVKSDVFSLAIVALELIGDTSDIPLPKDRLIKSCAEDQLHLNNLIKRLKIDQDLKNILTQASQVNPDKRYANMQLFYEDLNNWLQNKPTKATKPSISYILLKFAKRRTALFVTLVTLVLMLVLATVFQTWQYEKTLIAKQEAVEVKNFMLDVFSYANPEENIGQKLSALDLLSLADEEIKYKSFSDELVRADIMGHIGAAFVNLGGFYDGERNLLESLKLDPNNISSQIKLIQMYLDTSQPEKTTPYFASALKITSRSPNDFALEKAELTLLESAKTTFDKDDEKGIILAKQAQKLFINLNNIQGILKSTRLLSEKMFNHQESQKSIDLTLSVLDSLNEKVSPINTEFLRLKTSLVWMYTQSGQYKLAKPIIDDVIMNLRKSLGEKHPAIIDALVQRANVYKELGQMDRAIEDTKESYESAKIIFGDESQYAQQGLSMLAQLEFTTGNRKQAQIDLEKAIALSIKNYGAEHRLTLGAQIELSNYMAANGDFKKAIEHARKTQATLIKVFGEKHPQTIFGNNVLIKLLSTQEVDENTIKMAEKHNKTTVEVLGLKNPQSAYSFFVLGKIYSQAKQYDKANKAYEQILENNMVQANNPRYVALTNAIASNYKKINQHELAIEYATKSQQAAISIFGNNSIRSIESTVFLLDLLSQTKQAPYSSLLAELKKSISTGSISDEKLIKKIRAFE